MYLEKPLRFSKNFLKFLLCITVLSACTKGTFYHVKSIPTIKYTIPAEIQQNREVVSFIHNSTASLNSWAEVFDKLLSEQHTLIKSDTDRTIYQHVRLVNLSEHCLIQRQKFLTEHELMHENAKLILMQMNGSERNAFAQYVEELVHFKENVLRESNASLVISKTSN